MRTGTKVLTAMRATALVAKMSAGVTGTKVLIGVGTTCFVATVSQ
jgi:hypothetical protein